MKNNKLFQKLNDRTAHVVILGLGYVGLPLATVLADAGYQVTGVDLDGEKVKLLNQGISYIDDVETNLVKKLVDDKKLQATTDFSVVVEADAVSICVPTPLRKTRDPDLSYIVAVSESIVDYVHPDMVVVLESTTYPGTTRELLLPMLIEKSDLVVGENFYLAFSPERVDPGREDWTTINTPKVVGGITPACTEMAAVYYEGAMENVVRVTTTEVAEMTKLLENTFRMVNIGLVNEMAIMCDRMGINVWEVIDAAATKPFGFMKFTPGPGLGGHCIPIDPLFLSWKLKSLNYTARFIDLASEINIGMPRYVVGKVQQTLNKQHKAINDSKVLVLGAAYKPDIGDVRESPALDVIGLLQQSGAVVFYHDPFIPELHHENVDLSSVPDLMKVVESVDCVVIITNHSQYDYETIYKKAKSVMDARNALGKIAGDDPKVTGL
ncbi:MAG: UDP-N-acetyl-D-glucosamine dehydrogenase [Chloroflexota bacterium]|nr:MAG: UDP-N-acetyl-D-glucosamine dehydrogenase [Chloroflexota bacterium]HDD62051.1 nucleotide sugar dehydrogenase [Chloroflexota bacterium]